MVTTQLLAVRQAGKSPGARLYTDIVMDHTDSNDSRGKCKVTDTQKCKATGTHTHTHKTIDQLTD